MQPAELRVGGHDAACALMQEACMETMKVSRKIEAVDRVFSALAGRPFTLALYPGAEHGMTLFETAPDGERLSTRYAPGYFAMIRDFARDGRLSKTYGDAEITPEAPRPSGSRSPAS